MTQLTNGTTGTCYVITSGTAGDYLGNSHYLNGSTLTVQSDYHSNSFTPLNFNSNNMAQTRQAKIAIFEVTRDKKTNDITSSNFLKELWVEVKNGISIDLIAAKHLRGDYEPETIIVREVVSVYF